MVLGRHGRLAELRRRELNTASRRTAERLGTTLIRRGPDRPSPDPDALRLVYVDRAPTDDLVAVLEAHALG